MHFSPKILSRPLILVGMPGSGKSYWAQRWAAETEKNAVDLDKEIEWAWGKSIPEIFARRGEAGFRKIEREVLESTLLSGKYAFLATGGGTPCFGDNLQRMLETGTVIYLDAPVPLLAARISAQAHTRPLLQALSKEALLQKLSSLLAERAPFYRQAHYILSPHDLEAVTFAPL